MSEDDPSDRQADVRADFLRHDVVVTGQHLDVHAVLFQRRQRLASGLLRRVEEGDVSAEDEVLLVVLAEHRPAPGHVLVGNGEHAEALGLEPVQLLDQIGQDELVDLENVAVQLHAAAAPEDGLGRALRDQDAVAVHVHDDRHDPAREVERDLVDLADAGGGYRLVRQDGLVEQVLEPGLVVRVVVGVFQYALVLLADHVAVLLQDDAVLGERAGLVRAEHVHGAEVLDRVEALDDHLLPRHRDRADGERPRDDHRQHLGGEAHGDGEREEECLLPIVLGDPVEDEYDHRHHGHEAQQEQADAADALLEARERAPLEQALGDRPQVGRLSRIDDQGGRGAADHVGPEEGRVGQLQGVEGRPEHGSCRLLDGQRLTGQRGLRDEQVLRR